MQRCADCQLEYRRTEIRGRLERIARSPGPTADEAPTSWHAQATQPRPPRRVDDEFEVVFDGRRGQTITSWPTAEPTPPMIEGNDFNETE